MAQLHGQVVTQDNKVVGIVSAVRPAKLDQPDLVEEDLDTGEEVSRLAQPPLDTEEVDVVWENGKSSTLVAGKDAWVVLGTVAHFDANTDPKGESDEAKRKVSAAVADVKGFADEMRAAAPFAEAARPARRTAVRLDV